MIPLAVTGLGVVSPLGIGRSPWFERLRQGKELAGAFGAPSTFDGQSWPGAQVSEVRDFDPTQVLGDKGLRNLDRLTKLFLVAARGVLQDAGIKHGEQYVAYSPARVGVCGSTAYGSLEAMMELNRVALLESPRYLNPAKFPNTVINSALGYVSIWDDLRAFNTTVCNGNCGALDAVLVAETYLCSERAEAVLVGGAEAMHEALYLAFERLSVLASGERACAPGEPSSGGMRLGEGSVLFALEPEKAARARGARVLGTIVGYGNAFEPPESEALLAHMHPDPVERAVRAALSDAKVSPEQIDVVASCANGVPAYDAAERLALERSVGKNVCWAAPKAFLGETLGAGGGFALASALAWFDGAPVGPVIHGVAPGKVRTVLVTALGFYGNASAIVLRSD